MAITFAALATVGATLSARGALGVTLAEAGCVLAPTLLYLGVRRTPAAAIGLGRPPLVATAIALAAGAAASYLLAVGIETWLERVWPTPPELRQAMRRMVMPAAGARPLVVDLLTLALLPACAEELLFRGVVWEAWRPRLGAIGVLLATAIVFGLYHGSIHRFAPAALGGILIGVARAGSGSLWPAIAFHAANNAGVVVALHLGAR